MFPHSYEEKREKNLIAYPNCEKYFTNCGMIMSGEIGYADEKQAPEERCFCRSERLHIFINIFVHHGGEKFRY